MEVELYDDLRMRKFFVSQKNLTKHSPKADCVVFLPVKVAFAPKSS